MYVRIDGESWVTWQAMLDAVCRYVTTAPAGELAQYDAERLIAAGNSVLIRLAEERDKADDK